MTRMKCRTCGNEVSSEEAFCGQCGTPTVAPQALQTEMMHTSPPRTGQLNGYPPNETFGAQNNTRGGTPPLHTQGPSFPPSASMPPVPQLGSSQGTGFYRDATEAMSVLPSNPNAGYQQPYPASNAYPPQSTPTNYGFPGQAQPLQGQPLQTGNYVGQGYPQQQPVQGGQGYRSVPTPPQKQQNGAVIFIVSICHVIALLSVVGIGTLYVLKGRNATPNGGQTPVIVPTTTTVPTSTPDVPTPTPTVAPTDTVAPTPTATTFPTATPNVGFAYCGTLCTVNGFSTQYPQGWSASQPVGVQGVQFVNSNPIDQTATFKTPGATASSSNDLVTNDVQQNFATKTNYAVVTPMTNETIGGEPWSKEVITYQEAAQPQEQVEIYADAHQGKAYILELQASADQFATVATTDFATIKSQFQFQ